MHTIIGANPFHGSVRDGKASVQVNEKLLVGLPVAADRVNHGPQKAGCRPDSPLRAFADELAMNLTYSWTVTALVSMARTSRGIALRPGLSFNVVGAGCRLPGLR